MNFGHKNAQPFYFKGNNIGCLLIHGFTGCPAEMRLLGEELKDNGYTVRGVKLKGHGTSIEDMEKSTWSDWLVSAEEDLLYLQSKCDKVIVIGLSLGAIIALNLASKHDIAGVVSLSAPIKIKDKKVYYAWILKLFQKYIEKKKKEVDPEVEEYYIGYDRTPVACIPHLVRLIRKTKRKLKQIKCPTLIIQSKDDNTVEYSSAEIILNKIRSSFKKLLFLKNGGHAVTLGAEREKVFEEVSTFVFQLFVHNT